MNARKAWEGTAPVPCVPREYRITWGDIPPSYHTCSTPEKAREAAYYWRGWQAPIVKLEVLALASGPTQNQAGAGLFQWVPV